MGHGAISGIVRFICYLPLIVLAIFGTTNYIYVKKHAQILLVPPYNKHRILTAEGLSGPGVIVICILNFFFLIAIFDTSDKSLIYYGLVDAAIVSCLSYALYIESTFVGFTRPQCASVHANATADPHLLFFDRAGTVNMTDTRLGEFICKRFLAKWYLALVITILYFISAFFNIFVEILFKDDDEYYSRRRQAQTSPIKRMLAWLGFPLVFVWNLLQRFLALIFGWLPENLQGHIQYSFRSAGRWIWYKSSFAASKVNPMEIHLPRYLHQSKASDEKLVQMLLADLPYDVLQLIAAKVHYVDLVNLSLVSKRVRAIMFPGLEDSTEDHQLRFHSCRGNEKSTCWTCGVQVCEDCWKKRNAADSITSSHMRLCEAQCSKCFLEILLRPRMERRSCECYRNNSAPSYRYSKRRLICRDCNKLNDKKLVALREKRDKTVYRRLTLQSLVCAKCKELLPKTGLRWWVDTSCRRECRATCHPGYIEKVEL